MPALAAAVAFPLAAGLAAVGSYLIARSWVAAVLAMAASRVGRRVTFGQALMIGRGRHNLAWKCDGSSTRHHQRREAAGDP
jgi:hypothetical protein